MKRLITLFALLTFFAIGAQAQIVGANEGKKTSTNTTSSLYKPTGHYLRFEAGYPHFASVAYGYQLNPYIMIGGGLGFGQMSYKLHMWGENFDINHYDFQRNEGGTGVPFFVEAIISTPKYKWSFLADFKAGYGIPLSEYQWHHSYSDADRYESKKGNRFFGAINLGVSYKNFGLFAGISSNNFEWWSLFLSYNLPLKIHK